jgi:hypothetical protein
MAQIITVIISLIAIGMAFFAPLGAWALLSVPAFILFMLNVANKNREWTFVPELSSSANDMIQKYGHYYAQPFASRDFSASASTLALVGVVIGIIGLFHASFLGLGLAIVNYLVMGYLSKSFNPTVKFADIDEELAHEEIVERFVMSNIR